MIALNWSVTLSIFFIDTYAFWNSASSCRSPLQKTVTQNSVYNSAAVAAYSPKNYSFKTLTHVERAHKHRDSIGCVSSLPFISTFKWREHLNSAKRKIDKKLKMHSILIAERLQQPENKATRCPYWRRSNSTIYTGKVKSPHLNPFHFISFHFCFISPPPLPQCFRSFALFRNQLIQFHEIGVCRFIWLDFFRRRRWLYSCRSATTSPPNCIWSRARARASFPLKNKKKE